VTDFARSLNRRIIGADGGGSLSHRKKRGLATREHSTEEGILPRVTRESTQVWKESRCSRGGGGGGGGWGLFKKDELAEQKI